MTETSHEPVTDPSASVPESAEPNPNGLPKRLDGRHEVQDAVPTNAVARTFPGRMEVALDHARICARIAEDNRAKDILVLDLRGATPLIDFFVIASASSRRQASSLAFEIDAEMKKLGEHKLGIEGAEEGRWTLIDYGDFIVHLFSDEARTYYGLEDIWGDAPKIEWQDPARMKGGS
ncbi:MAG: iojap-like ribosome-associated protein [Planctomycetota bacterium]|nr:iojap-like ribosome-associated protein [Planctomycetota bacterium]